MPLEKQSLLNDRYRIDETIASGGMGAIYRATDETLGISVAVKENFFSTEDFSRQFRREATILASLRHPNLPRVTDHFIIPGQGQYLVMDFIEGSDLRELIARQGALPEEEVVRIGICVCDALEYLHTRNPAIVHRDIKPGNLKITSTGQVFLVDFGLAKFSRGEATTIGAQALTPGYAPPEQYGQGTETRSDLYSLGATLYAALTGKVPEDALNRAMGSAVLTPVQAHNPRASRAVAEVVERAMAVQISQRYQTAGSLKHALQAAAPHLDASLPVTILLSQVEATAPAPGRRQIGSTGIEMIARDEPEKARAPEAHPVAARKRRAPSILLLLGGLPVLFLAALALAYFLVPGLRATAGGIFGPAASAGMNETSTIVSLLPGATQTAAPTGTSTQPPLPSATAAPSQTPLPAPTATTAPSTATVPPAPAVTPDGGGLGEIAFSSDRDGAVQVWVIDVTGANPRQVTHLAGGACQPAWSPDGQQLAFISPCAGDQEDYAGSSLYLINADGSGLVPLASVPGGDYDPAWSPYGAQIAFTSLRDNGIPHVYLYNLTENSAKLLSHQSNHERQPAWSPDGQWLAYQTTRLGEPQIWIASPTGENAREFSTLADGFEWMPAWAPDGSSLVYSQGNLSRLVTRPVNDRQARESVVSESVTEAQGADFSPDGGWLVFEMETDGNPDIYVMLLNGSRLTRLTDLPGLDFHPAWRPGSK